MAYYLGVDGGGTRTVGVVSDERGIAVRRAESGSSNIHAVGADGVERALREMLAQLGVAPCDLSAVGIGLAGIGRQDDRRRVTPILSRLGFDLSRTALTHDAHIALVGGVGADSGVVLIAGTGSIAYGRSPSGSEFRCGGWGYLLGDEGSGYALGMNALRAVARSADARDEPTLLTDAILKSVGLANAEGLIRWARDAERHQIASLARRVFECASDGDAAARAIVRGGVSDLSELATTALVKHPWDETPVLALVGGLLERFRAYRDAIARRVFDLYPNVRIRTAEQQPVFGALRLALSMREHAA